MTQPGTNDPQGGESYPPPPPGWGPAGAVPPSAEQPVIGAPWVQPPAYITPSPQGAPPWGAQLAPTGPGVYGQMPAEGVTELGIASQEGAVVRRRSFSRMAPLAIGSVLALGGAGFVVTNLAGSAGSKNSPEQAVEQLFTAMGNEDVIGMLESVTPAERDALMDPVNAMRDHVVRLGIASDNLNLKKVAGFDFQVENLKVRATELSENVALVEATSGRITSIIRPSDLPVGSTLRGLLGDYDAGLDEAEDEIETTELSAGDGMRIMVVKRDGRWAVSLGYSAFELARRDGGKPMPAFGSGQIKALGAETPEAAVAGMADAIAAGDFEAIIGHLDPEEAAAAYDYAPLYLDEAKRSMRELDKALKSLSLETSVTGKGDRRLVGVDAFRATLDADGEATVEWDGECFTITPNAEKASVICSGDDEMAEFEDLFDMDALDAAGIGVHQVDGKWYVSPTRTVLDNLNLYLSSVDDDALDKLPDLFGGMMFGLGDSWDDDSWDDDPAYPECDDELESIEAWSRCVDEAEASADDQGAAHASPTTTAPKSF